MFYRQVKKNWKVISDRYANKGSFFKLNPAKYSLFKGFKKILPKYIGGKIVDVGAGRLAYKNILNGEGCEYISVDIDKTSNDLNIIGDAQALPFKSGCIDLVFSTQVLEHVPDVSKAVDEFFRVLKNSGSLIVSVPHLSWVHNEPNDYLRFTKYGIAHYLETAGFEVVEVIPAGGILSFLGNIYVQIWLGLFWNIPLINRACLFCTLLFSQIISFFDSIIERKKFLALNYIALGKKQ